MVSLHARPHRCSSAGASRRLSRLSPGRCLCRLRRPVPQRRHRGGVLGPLPAQGLRPARAHPHAADHRRPGAHRRALRRRGRGARPAAGCPPPCPAGPNQAAGRRLARGARRCPSPPVAQVRYGQGHRLWHQALAGTLPLPRRRAAGDRQQYRRACPARHRNRKTQLAVRRLQGGRRACRCDLHRHPDLQSQRRRPAGVYRRRHRQGRRRLAYQPLGC